MRPPYPELVVAFGPRLRQARRAACRHRLRIPWPSPLPTRRPPPADVQPVAERDPRSDHHRPRHRPAVHRARRGRLAGMGGAARLERRDRVPGHVRPHRPRRDGRLSPPPDASRLRHEALGARDACGARVGRDRGAGDLVGGGPPQAPRIFGPGGGPAQSACRPRRRPARSAARPGARARGLAVHPHPPRRQGALRARPARRPGGAVRRPHVPGLGDRRAWRRRSRSATRSAARWTRRSRACSGAAECGCSFVHHVTYSINSLCHFFGSRRFPTGDESRNLAWLAPFTFGEAWHNNHHAFPTSAAHGLRRWEVDPSAAVIWVLERLGLAWDVVRVTARAAGREARRRTQRDDPRRRDGAAAHGAGRGSSRAPVHGRVLGRHRPAGHQRIRSRPSSSRRRGRLGTCCGRPASSASGART